MLRMFSTSSNKSVKSAAIKLLNEMKQEFQSKEFPLKNTMLSTVKLVEDAINGKKPINNEVIKNAALIDSPLAGNPIVKSLVEIGVNGHLNKEDIAFIRISNKDAAEFLEQHIANRFKVSTP